MIKGKCIESYENTYTFQIETKSIPIIGDTYSIDNACIGSQAQNKAFHALVGEYFRSGMHSYDVGSFDKLKNQIKKKLGEGFESYVWASIEYTNDDESHCKMYDAKTIEEIPERVKNDPHMKDMIRGKLKSWSDYTKKQRTTTIDNLITEMIEAGVNSPVFDEILEGMGG